VRPRLDWLVRLVATVMAGALLITASVVGIAPQLWGLANAHEIVPVDLPPFEGLATRTQILDIAGRQVGVYALQNSQPLVIDEVPEHVISAILAVEDAGFYGHRGVNVRSLVRATLSNFQNDSGRQGASTITQQVVKNEYLAGMQRDGRYKVLQSRYAVLLERQATKDQILERYLNTVYFGNNAYGLQAAAEVYFGVKVKDLTLMQAGYLAGLIRAPSAYDPIRRPDEVEPTLLSFQLPTTVKEVPEQLVRRSYFSEMVRDYLLNRSDILGATYQERYAALYRGGLKIHTTLDAAAQTAAEQAVRDRLPENKTGVTAALVSVETATGAVRAVVGGPGFTPRRNEVNLALRRRQTGSSIKIFILTAALEAGVLPYDLIEGTMPCTFPNPGKPEEPFVLTQGESTGVETLARQTALSINCAYARLSQIVGLNRLPGTVYRLAGSAYLSPETFKIQPYASFATGANELSTMDMAAGAQVIANGGVKMEPYLIERIEGPDGTIWTRQPNPVQVISKEVADTQVSVLKGVMTFGTGRRSALANGRPSAGKTGTQDDNTNAWFIGFTKQLTTAVWVGDPKGYTPMVNIPEFKAVGVPRVQGATFPARIWKSFMDAAHGGLPVLDWDAPPKPTRNQVRLYLPGTDCVAELVSGVIPAKYTGSTAATVVPTVPATAAPVPSTTSTTSTTVPGVPPPVTTVAPTPSGNVVRVIDPGTTIAPDVTDPTYPVGGLVPGRYLIYSCAEGVPKIFTTVN